MTTRGSAPTYSLWRNGTLLGRFVQRKPVKHHDIEVGAAGVLELTDATTKLTPMFQHSIPILPGAPIFQSPIEPMVVGKEPAPTQGQREPRKLRLRTSMGLHPLSEEETRGVPREQILEIRDEHDRVIETSMIMLNLFVIRDDVDAAEELRAQGLPGDTREIWNIGFSTQMNTPRTEPRP